jgi:hypothetical protein
MAVGLDVSRVSKIRDIVKSLVGSHFSSTLGRETDVVNIINALVLQESSFNVNSIGAANSTSKGTAGYSYKTSSAIAAKYTSGNSTERANLDKGVRAVGLMQVVGWNLIKGGAPNGVCELERIRPDLSSTLVVNPGEDIYTAILGEPNMSKAILAGLIVLEGKYKATFANGSGFSVKGDPAKRTFSSRISGAVAAYLGLGKSDVNGTTPESYSDSIVGGKVYAEANGGNPIKISDSKIVIASSNGPSTNGSNQSPIGSAGCTPVHA